MKNIRLLLTTIFTLFILSFILQGKVARAEEIIISGNGDESVNTVSRINQETTVIQQSNNSDTTNTINISANTGDNSAEGNTGENTQITTGNTDVAVSIDNAVNKNVIDSSCCASNTSNSSEITSNGSASDNTISTHTLQQTTTTSNQNATVTNNISGTANTGSNLANNNGNVSITTGRIRVNENVKNYVNLSVFSVDLGFAGSEKMKISKNGSESENKIEMSLSRFLNIFASNTSDIKNNTDWDLTTGENSANSNNGNVILKTGDIIVNAKITQEVNKNIIAVTCCEKEKEEKPIPPVSPTPPVPSESVGGKGNGEAKPGENPEKIQVLGAAVGNILPVTGVNWFLFALLGNVVMLFMGAYLRLRAGRSPNTYLRPAI